MEFSLIILSRLLMYVTNAVFIFYINKNDNQQFINLTFVILRKIEQCYKFWTTKYLVEDGGDGGGGGGMKGEGREGKEEVLRSNDNKIGCTVTSK